MKDYRFSYLTYGLRKENRGWYAFSLTASEDLQLNHSDGSEEYTEEMWDDFWQELKRDYEAQL